MIDEHAKDLLEHFARRLIFGISREQDRLHCEIAAHTFDESRWQEFLDHVGGLLKQPLLDCFEVAQHAEQVRLLLIQFGLTPEGATHWAGKFRRDWERLEGGYVR